MQERGARESARAFAFGAMMGLALSATAAGQLADPDGKPADMSKPVQVYILLGQSNMLGFGKIKGGEGSLEHAVKEKGLYPYLVDDAGQLDRAQGRPQRARHGKRDRRHEALQQRVDDDHRRQDRPGDRHRASPGATPSTRR